MDLRRLLRAAPFVLVGLGALKLAGVLVVGPRLGLPMAPLLAAGVLWVVGPAAWGIYLQRARSRARQQLRASDSDVARPESLAVPMS